MRNFKQTTPYNCNKVFMYARGRRRYTIFTPWINIILIILLQDVNQLETNLIIYNFD